MNERHIRQAIILAGGFGTRLGALTRTTPKPLLPIAGKPFIAYQIDWLARHGIEDILISTGYLAQSFQSFLTNNRWLSPYGTEVRVRALAEDTPAGTAGALKVHHAELAERFLLVNGDSFFDCDLAVVLNVASRHADATALLTVRDVPDAGRYGRIELSGDRVVAFHEKTGEAQPGLINAGITVLSRSVVDRIETVPCSIERDIYPTLAAEGSLKAIQQDGYFIDIGLPETYVEAQSALPAAVCKPAVFLDRDGVINPDIGYLHKIEDFSWLPGVVKGISEARLGGRLVIVVTNQAGVARGLYDIAAIEKLHRHINELLRSQAAHPSAWIDRFYYCPFHPDGVVPAYRGAHRDRKPEPGMILRALADFPIDRAGSFLVGDKDSDVAAAQAAGITGYLIDDTPLDAFLAPRLRG